MHDSQIGIQYGIVQWPHPSYIEESGDLGKMGFGQYLVSFLACDWLKPSILDRDWSTDEVVSAMFDPDNHEKVFYW